MNIRLVGGVIAVALMAGGYFLMDRTYDAALPTDMSPEAVDAQLQAEQTELFRFVKVGFPEQYGALTMALSEALRAGAGQAELAGISQDAMTNLRQMHADKILAAPDGTLREIVTMSRELHVSVRDAEGREACNRFAIGGPPTLGAELGKYLVPLDSQGTAVLQAIVAGRDSGAAPTEPATAEDWTAAQEHAVSIGSNPAHMQALTDLDQENGDLCAGLIGLLDAFADMETVQGRRLRASYVRDLARN